MIILGFLYALFVVSTTCSGSHLRESSSGKRDLQELPSIEDVILSDPALSTLASALEAAELLGTLCTDCNFTAFAPTNEAFAAVNQTMLESLLTPNRISHLQKLLLFHITIPTADGNRLLSTDFVDGQVLQMLSTDNVTLNVLKQGISIASPLGNSSRIVDADVLASNGVLNMVDTVLLPEFLEMNVFDFGEQLADFKILDELFELAGLSDLEGEFTVLAPDDDAWLALGEDTLTSLRSNTVALEATLRNHLIDGINPPNTLIDGRVLPTLGGLNVTVSSTTALTEFAAAQESNLMFNNAIVTDVFVASNGIAYRLDSVLVDPFPTEPPNFAPSSAPIDAPLIETPEIAPSIVPIATPIAIPIQDPVAIPIIAPIPVPFNAPMDAPLVLPILVQTPVGTPIEVPIVVPIETPITVPMTTPVETPIAVPMSIPTETPITVPVTIPVEAPMAVPISVPMDIPITIPTNIPVEVPVTLPPIVAPASIPSNTPSETPAAIQFFCIDFVCGDGYLLRENPETRPGNDRATCCYRDGVCAGAPVGAMCSLGDVDSSLIPNPSFEEFTACPNGPSQLSLAAEWVQATEGTSDYFIGAPTCDDTWYKNGYVGQLGEIPQNATDGDAFVGSIKSIIDGDYYEYVGACLNDPLVVGVEYTFTLDVAAATDIFIYGGDTNGETDLLCIPTCGLFPIEGFGYKGNQFEILATAAPEGGLVGGADWKSITFNFVPNVNCSAIMFGPSANQTIQPTQEGSYVIYDVLNLQEGAAGACNEEGECVPTQFFPTATPSGFPVETPISVPTPTSIPSNTPSEIPTAIQFFCIDFVCGDGYLLRENPETRSGNDRATCCYRDGVCAGAPVGAMCSLGDIDSSLIPNPSFEEFTSCPSSISELFLSTTWIQATEGTSDFFIQSPTCDDAWFRNGIGGISAIPQNATDGDAFVGSIKEFIFGDYYEYIGACLNDPLVVGVEYTFTVDVAAATDNLIYGGDTNGETDLLCIPACDFFPIEGFGYKGNDFEILATAAPEGGLVGGADWKSITFNFVPTVDCPAIMFGPSANQTIQTGERGSYVIYDFLNLQEGAAGVCNQQGECVPSQSFPTTTPSSRPSFPPSGFCANDDDNGCNDNNFCTTDICIEEVGCENLPVICDANEACDPIDGVCRDIESVRPCIAIIDESDSFSDEEINAKWAAFRTAFPTRPFCLLQPFEAGNVLFLPTMPDFLSDNRTTFAKVNRDEGNETLISDWFDLCGYSDLAVSGIDFVGLFVDESGSMTRDTVQASLDNFFTDLNNTNLTYCLVFDGAENWIDPFNTLLGISGGGGDCGTNTNTSTPTPTAFTPTPTSNAFPTVVTQTPTSAPTVNASTPTAVQIIELEDYYITFVVPNATREPTQEEYVEMLARIDDWFKQQVEEQYANNTEVQFLGVQSSVDLTSDLPTFEDSEITMRVEFSNFTFSGTSVLPTFSELVDIQETASTPEFILEVVRSFTGTPFESTIEVRI